MAFSRIRKGLAGGDFDRSANQQRTLRGIHARIRAQADCPGFIEQGVMTVMDHMATDASPGELYELAQAVAQVDPRRSPRAWSRAGWASSVRPAWSSPTSPGAPPRRRRPARGAAALLRRRHPMAGSALPASVRGASAGVDPTGGARQVDHHGLGEQRDPQAETWEPR